MPELYQLQEDFFNYLTGDATGIINNVVEQGNIDRKTRLDIYQNAYNVRLQSCIETDHPVLGLYLGDELFEKMVSEYIRQYPSRYPSLRQFCDQLPKYLKENEPFRSFPIIAEIATFERMLMDAFDAADDSRITEAYIQNLPAEKWPDMKLKFHPSVRVYESCWNSVESWQALKNEKSPPEAKEEETCWIIWRNAERLTQYQSLTVDGFVLFQCLRDNYTFADACELLKEHLPDDQIGPATLNHLLNWFRQGLIREVAT